MQKSCGDIPNRNGCGILTIKSNDIISIIFALVLTQIMQTVAFLCLTKYTYLTFPAQIPQQEWRFGEILRDSGATVMFTSRLRRYPPWHSDASQEVHAAAPTLGALLQSWGGTENRSFTRQEAREGHGKGIQELGYWLTP